MAVRSGWDSANKAKEEADERAKKGGKFLSLDDDGEKVVVAFLGEPTVREIVWENNTMSMYTKEHEERGVAPQVKFSFNVYNKDAGKVQIFEQGSLWFKTLLACKNKYGLEKCWFEISRDGAKGDKETRYKTLFEDKMSDEEVKAMHEIETSKDGLYDLAKEAIDSGKKKDEKNSGKSDNKTSTSSSLKNDNAFISDKTKEMLVAKLTELPGNCTKQFLAEFGVEKLRLLPQSALDAAVLFIEKMEIEAKGGKEVNPFD